VDETVTPMEELCAALEYITEQAMEDGLSTIEIVGALTIKAQAMGLSAFGFFVMRMPQAMRWKRPNANRNEVEEV
jgi:predicted benzoate:H+ symporter BenE